MNRVKQLSRYKKNLLFRGIDGNNLHTVQLYGTDLLDQRTVRCSRLDEMLDPTADKTGSAFEYAIWNEEPVILIYDGDRFEEPTPDMYRLKTDVSAKEALIAAFRLV